MFFFFMLDSIFVNTIFRVDYGHEEVRVKWGKDPRQYSTTTKEFVSDGNGHIKGVNTVQVEWTQSPTGQWSMKEVAGSEKYFPADLILLAMGFLGPEKAAPTEMSEFLSRFSRILEYIFAECLIYRSRPGRQRKHQNHGRNLWHVESEGVCSRRLPPRTVAGRLGHLRGSSGGPSNRQLSDRQAELAARTGRSR